jgi:hypothetical protein
MIGWANCGRAHQDLNKKTNHGPTNLDFLSDELFAGKIESCGMEQGGELQTKLNVKKGIGRTDEPGL